MDQLEEREIEYEKLKIRHESDINRVRIETAAAVDLKYKEIEELKK